jgi:hypothetical protein
MTMPPDPSPDVAMEDAWLVVGVQTGRGEARRKAGGPVEPMIGLTVFCQDLPVPGKFLFRPDDAEVTANALLDSVRKWREEQA